MSHPEAVLSIGASDHVEAVDDVTPPVIHRQVCGYIHVFADDAEYETGTDDVAAATTAIPVETGLGLPKALATTMFANER